MICDFKDLDQLDKIQFFKKITIDVKKVISNTYQDIRINKNKNKNFLFLFKIIIIEIFTKKIFKLKFEKKLSSEYVFFFNDPVRNDKLRIFNNIVKSFKNENSVAIIKDINKFRFSKIDHIKDIAKKIYLTYFLIFNTKFSSEINFQNKLKLTHKLLEFYNDYRELINFKYNQKSIFFFNCEQYFQNMVCQIVNKKNVTTFSCDHAIYSFQQHKHHRMFDSLAYNMCSKYHLCWGNFSKFGFEDLLKCSNTKFVEVCHPLRDSYQLVFNHLKYNNTYSHIILLLSQKKFFIKNYEMINLVKIFAKKKNFTYSIKLHASDEKKKYDNINFKDKLLKEVIKDELYITELYNSTSICVFYKTSGYFELASKGVPTFKYIDDENYLGAKSFNKLEELEDFIEDKISQPLWYRHEVLPYLNFFYGKFTKNPSDKYKKIITEYR